MHVEPISICQLTLQQLQLFYAVKYEYMCLIYLNVINWFRTAPVANFAALLDLSSDLVELKGTVHPPQNDDFVITFSLSMSKNTHYDFFSYVKKMQQNVSDSQFRSPFTFIAYCPIQ